MTDPSAAWKGGAMRQIRGPVTLDVYHTAARITARAKGSPHAAVGRLPALVPGRGREGGAGRKRAGPRHDGDPAVGLRHLGADPARARRPDQGGRRTERILPAVHPRELPAPG